MTDGRRRWLAVFVVLASALVACTSESSDDDDVSSNPQSTGVDSTAGGDDTGPPPQGVSDDTIKIALIASDLSALSEQNLAPEIGNAEVTLQAVVDDINAGGGVAGRQIELIPHVIAGADAAINPEAGRQACVKATEDDPPFAVIITAAISAETVECSLRHEGNLTITMDSWPDSFYEDAAGRLFSVATHLSVGRQRAYREWPKVLDTLGALDGKTIGVVRIDRAEQEEAVEEGLEPGLEALGYEIAAEAVLPCPEGTEAAGCEQHDVAIQRLKDGGADFVFLVAQTLSASATVEAAQNLDFTPQWTTTGNNVTDTVARFFVNAKGNYDGAWGIDGTFPDINEATDECNRVAVAGGAEAFPPDSDGYSYTGVTCLQLQTLVEAIATAAADGSFTQASVIQALEGLDEVPMAAGPPGSLGADKHDAGDFVFVSRYDAAQEKFVDYDEAAPIEVG